MVAHPVCATAAVPTVVTQAIPVAILVAIRVVRLVVATREARQAGRRRVGVNSQFSGVQLRQPRKNLLAPAGVRPPHPRPLA